MARRYGAADVYLWWRGLRNVFLPASVAFEGRPLYPGGGTSVAGLLEPLRKRGRPCVVFEFASYPWGTAEGREEARSRRRRGSRGLPLDARRARPFDY